MGKTSKIKKGDVVYCGRFSYEGRYSYDSYFVLLAGEKYCHLISVDAVDDRVAGIDVGYTSSLPGPSSPKPYPCIAPTDILHKTKRGALYAAVSEDRMQKERMKQVFPSKPKRIQFFKKKGNKIPPNTVRVDVGKWADPFRYENRKPGYTLGYLEHLIWSRKVNRDYSQDCQKRQRKYLKQTEDCIDQLVGKDIACSCEEGKFCHGDTLLRVARLYGQFMEERDGN